VLLGPLGGVHSRTCEAGLKNLRPPHGSPVDLDSELNLERRIPNRS
jgi:hypothetical protein